MRNHTKHQKIYILLFIFAFSGIGAYFVYATQADMPPLYQKLTAGFSYADPGPGIPGYDPAKRNSAVPNTVQNITAVGDTVLLPMELHSENDYGQESPRQTGRFTVVTTYRYPSKFLKLDAVHCERNTRCISIPDTGIEPSLWYVDTQKEITHYINRSFSVCADRPTRNPNAPMINDTENPNMVAAKFTVIDSSDAYIVSATSRVYYDASCDVNNGVSSNYWNIRYSMQCLNREANKLPGNDGNGRPIECGLGHGGGAIGTDEPVFIGGITPVSATSTNTNAQQNSGPNPQNGTAPNRNPNAGSGGGSSASKQNNTENTIPAPTTTGETPTRPDAQPDPFFDGEQYSQGSENDNFAGILRNTGKQLVRAWYFVIPTVALAAGAGFYFWQKRKQNN